MANSNRWMVLGMIVSGAAAFALGCSEDEPQSASEAQAINQGDGVQSTGPMRPDMNGAHLGEGLESQWAPGEIALSPAKDGPVFEHAQCVPDPSCASGERCKTCKSPTDPASCVEECSPIAEPPPDGPPPEQTPPDQPPLKGCSGGTGSTGSTGSGGGGTGGGGGGGGGGGDPVPEPPR